MENTNTPVIDITLADLDLLKNIVDLASARGAFRGSELKDVGEVYNKLTAFLNVYVEQAKKAQESENQNNEAPNPPQGE